MPPIPSRNLFDFLTRDFEKAWNAMALATFDENVGGNFMFARQAMLLLELASRVAGTDDAVHERFSTALAAREPLYFTELPAGPPPTKFRLPHRGKGSPERQLLAVLFDLVRNGQSHYGLQLQVPLSGESGAVFAVSIGGVQTGRTLDRVLSPDGRPIGHLAFRKRDAGHFELWMDPGVLYLDVKHASEAAGVWKLQFNPWRRKWALSGADLEAAIKAARPGHVLLAEDGQISHPQWR